MSYVVITEETNGPGGGTVVEYGNRETAESAIHQHLARLHAQGSTIEGDVERGYTAWWWERGQLVKTRITLGQVQ